MEIFAEGFNVLNHTNFNGYNSTIAVSTATTATTALSTPVLLNAPSPNNFGNPNQDGSQPDGTNARRLQFSVRLKF